MLFAVFECFEFFFRGIFELKKPERVTVGAWKDSTNLAAE